MPETKAPELTVNGRGLELDVPPFFPLAVVLREELGMTGTKTGCFEGRCGACTVEVDGETVVSCIYPIGLAYGAVTLGAGPGVVLSLTVGFGGLNGATVLGTT